MPADYDIAGRVQYEKVGYFLGQRNVLLADLRFSGIEKDIILDGKEEALVCQLRIDLFLKILLFNKPVDLLLNFFSDCLSFSF
ncbi:Uncharacterised protein [Bacillus licheniformis]|nr:Uncharacterised protein [Bacillus licheniformis]